MKKNNPIPYIELKLLQYGFSDRPFICCEKILSVKHSRYIENTRFASFDIKFARLGFEKAC